MAQTVESLILSPWLLAKDYGLMTNDCWLLANLDVQVEEVEFGAVGFDEFAAGGDTIAH